jgi:hypothetical protein
MKYPVSNSNPDFKALHLVDLPKLKEKIHPSYLEVVFQTYLWTLTMEAWGLKMEALGVCRPLVADSHHFDEEQDPDLDPH